MSNPQNTEFLMDSSRSFLNSDRILTEFLCQKFDIMVCLDVMDGMDLLYCMALWSLWTQARRTTYELSVCEHMYTSIRTPSACISMYVAFSAVLFVRGLFDGLGLFLRSLSNACAEKKIDQSDRSPIGSFNPDRNDVVPFAPRWSGRPAPRLSPRGEAVLADLHAVSALPRCAASCPVRCSASCTVRLLTEPWLSVK